MTRLHQPLCVPEGIRTPAKAPSYSSPFKITQELASYTFYFTYIVEISSKVITIYHQSKTKCTRYIC